MKKRPGSEDLLPGKNVRENVMKRLYQRDPIAGEDGIFTILKN